MDGPRPSPAEAFGAFFKQRASPAKRLVSAGVMVSLRTAQPKDEGAVWRIFLAILAEGATYAPDERTTEADFLRDFFGRGGEQWLAESGGQVVGAYTLRPNQPGRGAHIATASYGVESAARGLGVGRALGRHSIERARAGGYRAIQFNFVVSTNTSAVRLWEDLGFEVLATLPKAYHHRQLGPVDAYLMWLGL
jgi:ribosomal protein S18 acetylase RimI-like enzyme